MKHFAYGSNMDIKRLNKREVYPSKRERATLHGYSIKFNKKGTANPKEGKTNIVRDPSGVVEGILCEITEAEMRKLDKAEGVSTGDYFRTTVRVKVEGGTEIDAVTYIANPMKVRNGLKPTRDYLAHLLAGKSYLSTEYYERMKSTETLD